MLNQKRSRTGSAAPVFRHCALCSQPKTIYPLSDEHRRAHLSKQIAFVCDECAGKVRLEVELAGGTVDEPKVSA